MNKYFKLIVNTIYFEAIFCTFSIIFFSRPDFFFLFLIVSNSTKSVNFIQQNPSLIYFQKYLIDNGNMLKNIFGQSHVRNILAFLSNNQTGLLSLYLYANQGTNTFSNRFLNIAGQSHRHTGNAKTNSSASNILDCRIDIFFSLLLSLKLKKSNFQSVL